MNDPAPLQTVKVRGLVRLSSVLFAAWGALVAGKGAFDRFLGGTPEANLYAPRPWAFVTEEQWRRYASFELLYGLACLGLGLLLWRYAARLPETYRRPAPVEGRWLS